MSPLYVPVVEDNLSRLAYLRACGQVCRRVGRASLVLSYVVLCRIHRGSVHSAYRPRVKSLSFFIENHIISQVYEVFLCFFDVHSSSFVLGVLCHLFPSKKGHPSSLQKTGPTWCVQCSRPHSSQLHVILCLQLRTFLRVHQEVIYASFRAPLNKPCVMGTFPSI